MKRAQSALFQKQCPEYAISNNTGIFPAGGFVLLPGRLPASGGCEIKGFITL
jgi:hypothetical protein